MRSYELKFGAYRFGIEGANTGSVLCNITTSHCKRLRNNGDTALEVVKYHGMTSQKSVELGMYLS